MALSGVRKKRLSKREGSRNSNLPGMIRPLDRGEGDPVMTGVHGSEMQPADNITDPCAPYHEPPNRTKMESGWHQASPGRKCEMKGVPQAQGADPNIGTENVAPQTATRRSHIKGHGGSGPNRGYGKAMKKY